MIIAVFITPWLRRRFDITQYYTVFPVERRDMIDDLDNSSNCSAYGPSYLGTRQSCQPGEKKERARNALT